MIRLVILIVGTWIITPAALLAQTIKKSDIRVLYVGGSTEFEVMDMIDYDPAEIEASARIRMKSFEDYLNEYFNYVTVINAKDYSQAMSDDYDVTVMDGLPDPVSPAYIDREKGISIPEGYLDEDFDRPLLSIGYISEKIGRRIGTKNDWYCLCLESHVHSWRGNHPIFNGPFEVTMTVEDIATPEPIFSYPHHFNGSVPQTLPMWRVQTYEGFDPAEMNRIGMVCRPGGYEDSPEAEYISSGLCAKSPDAVAIGRHGNFFHWGFAASPANMTEEAKPVLANAIAYISRFAGQTPIARKYNDRIVTRSYARDMQQFLSREAYGLYLKKVQTQNQTMEKWKVDALKKLENGEELSPQEAFVMNNKPINELSYEQYIQRTGRECFEMFGADEAAYKRYFEENYDYFYSPDTHRLVPDEDAKSLGIPNNDVRLLDEAIKLIETGTDADRGKRILSRYTLMDLSTPAEWRDWFDTYKDLLFFTESGGWLFLVDSREPGMNDYRKHRDRIDTRILPAGETSDSEPVIVSGDILIIPEGSRMLKLTVKIHPGYHIYDNVSEADPFIKTSIEVVYPDRYAPTEEISRPSGEFYNQRGTTVYSDTVVLTQPFDGTGTGDIICKITYQCCDHAICFPPEVREVRLKLL